MVKVVSLINTFSTAKSIVVLHKLLFYRRFLNGLLAGLSEDFKSLIKDQSISCMTFSMLYATVYNALYYFIVVPVSYVVYQSNHFDSNFQCLEDPRCTIIASLPQVGDDRDDGGNDNKKRSSGAQMLLTCTGPNSTLFDGVIGRDIDDTNDFVQTDFSQYYIWRRDTIPEPRIEMSFDPPLIELPNIIMTFFRQGDIRPPFLSMCFSRTLNFDTCDNIIIPDRPGGLANGVVVWPIPLLTNTTSVTYLRINMQYNRDFIFLSEIRVAERLQGIIIGC